MHQNGRIFNGPDGYQYRWCPSNNQYNDVIVSGSLAPGSRYLEPPGRAPPSRQARARTCAVASDPHSLFRTLT